MSVLGKIDDAGEILVPTISLDEAAKLLDIAPHIIRIDVEAAELDVIKGAKETLSAAGHRRYSCRRIRLN
jgi:FkbM family methyltransferase